MNTHFETLDATARAIKEDCERELRAMSDKLLAAEIESSMCKEHFTKERAEKERYMRIATKLITQFGAVEQIFAEAKKMAMALEIESEDIDRRLPKVEP